MSTADNLEGMLEHGNDNALLRFALGTEYLKTGELDKAVQHLSVAVTIDPDYSAAWKMLGKAQAAAGLTAAAAEAYRRGIEVADRCGDRQSAKEMEVFLRRLEKDG
ncbi:MAG: tetratricopeptide repeat protein [Candidatus Rariloculaceae bacterium]